MAFRYVLLLLALLSFPLRSECCTSVIISGKVTADGRPLMWKNRDTDHLDNSLRHFRGERYSFTGLVNSDSEGGEVWIGINTAGFAVMNTASYCLKNDDVPSSMMDREGILMYRALEICASLDDFENFLDTLSRPMGVEANFGCIDAHGGAAWYETGNFSYTKIDVNECHDGFYVVTNFSVSGDKDRWKGIERHITAQGIFNRMRDNGFLFRIRPCDIIDSLSRSYRQDMLGIDLVRDADDFLSGTSGLAADLDFIPRRSTSASVVIHGVGIGEEPSRAVIWAALGYPATSVTVPVPVSGSCHIPEELSSYPVSGEDTFCGVSSYLKWKYVFFPDISSMSRYVCLKHVLRSDGSLMDCAREAEKRIRDIFLPLYSSYLSGRISKEEYMDEYDIVSSSFFGIYTDSFENYLHTD